MKKYIVELVEFENGETNPEVCDLVNVDDSSDRIMAAPDEFMVGEIVNEDEFEIRQNSMVDEQTYGTGDFAFKK